MSTDLVKADAMHLARVSGVDVGALLEKAIDAKSAVEVLEKLSALRREARAEAAKEAFDRALAEFQAECPTIVKAKAAVIRGSQAYKYAPLDAIVGQVRSLLRANGFSYSLTSEVDAGWVKAVCKVTHSAGHSECSEFKVPATTKSPLMSDPQMYASALTFAKRYAFCNAFGILTGDEDTDAGDPNPKPKGPSNIAPDNASTKDLARELWHLLERVRGPEKNWQQANQWLIDECVLAPDEQAPNLTPQRFREVIEKAKGKL